MASNNPKRILILDLKTGEYHTFDDPHRAAIGMWGMDAKRYKTYIVVDPLPIEVGEYEKALVEVLEKLEGKLEPQESAIHPNDEVGPRTPIEWDNASPDPWTTKPKEQ